MGKVKLGAAAAGLVLVVTEWLMVSHAVSWLMSGALPR